MAQDHHWDDSEHARSYLANRQEVPHRKEAEAVLVDTLGADVGRVIDLGAGDGRVLGCVLDAHLSAEGVALDHNSTMLEAVTGRFAGQSRVSVVQHDLAETLPAALGRFDSVVSALTLHHFDVARRRSLIGEIAGLLHPGGVFADLDLVCSPTEALHDRFIDRVPWDSSPDSAWDRHPTLVQRLSWLDDAGFTNVDCIWKWRELALVVGESPT
jgi:tRNA (cmo5U34)-methyltransferase